MKRKKNLENVLMYFLFFVFGLVVSSMFYSDYLELEANEEEKVDIIEKPREVLEGSAKIVAVSQDNQGLLGGVNVSIYDGNGKVLVNTNPFLEPDTQYSANIAVDLAENITQISLDDKNIVFDFDINGTVLGGPSAGAAMTIATIAAIENLEPNKIVVTGSVLPGGEIGQVGAIPQKAQVVIAAEYDVFLIPKGQSKFTYYEREVKKRNIAGAFTIYNTYYTPKTIDLREYFEQETGLKIIEVENINEVIAYAF